MRGMKMSAVSVPQKWKKVLSSDALLAANDAYVSSCIEREKYNIYPAEKNIYRAIELCSPEDVKVVMIGQDPYHTPGVATGLAFASPAGYPLPASLKNIFKEMSTDLGIDEPKDGNLDKWAEQGVILLNTVLTVREGQANSHVGFGWQRFTSDVIRYCLFDVPSPVAFVLWGRQACGVVDDLASGKTLPENRIIIRSTHPSPLSAANSRGGLHSFFGSRPFSRVNEFLESSGASPVRWQ